YPVTVTVTDSGLPNLTDTETFSIAVAEVNVAPVLTAIGDKSVNQLANLAFTATATDPDVPNNVLTFSLVGAPAGAAINAATGVFTWMPTGLQCAGIYTFTVKVTDNGSPALSDEEVIQVTVINTLPVISSITGPSGPVTINTPISITVSHNDNNLSNAVIKWDDATSTVQNVPNPASGSFTVSHTYSTPGVYSILVTLTDACGASSVTVQYDYIVVYDPNGGFVTGGGWINSPAGAWVGNPAVIGKANFGFVAKYKKGSTVPDGNTEFQFKEGNLNFNSSSYDDMRLVISGTKANYKGVGKINGSGNYGFLVSAIDGGAGADKFRIKIWNKDNGNAVVYDNNMGNDENDLPTTILGGGSIVIHEVKKNAKVKVELVEKTTELLPFNVMAYPNPSSQYFTIEMKGNSNEKVEVVVYDALGRMVKHIENSVGQEIKLGEEFPSGAYIAIISQGINQKTIRLIKE
ncbi:T9SS type A sorting domain-containing protein, partial [Flavobacterium sp. XS2P12]|uniref:T9SS type A sorting domain-containing protein n=1 Tax=Flavobacterium melibiosi TaxID=3398734 RepID=UPI003A8ACA3B